MIKLKFVIVCSLFLFISCNKKHTRQSIIAEVNGEKIFSEEIDRITVQEIFDELNRIHAIKDMALESLIKERLLLQEAKKANKTIESYVDNYIDSLLNTYTYDSLLEKYKIDQNLILVERNSLTSVDPRSYEGRILQKKQLEEHVKLDILNSLILNSNVKKYLYPPRNPTLNLQPYVVAHKGKPDAKVTMLLVSDFDCNKCIEYHSIYDSIYNNYKDKIKFGYINFSAIPTIGIIAAHAASKQNKFWEFHDELFATNERIDSSKVYHIAKTLNMDLNKFTNDFNSKELIASIESNFANLHEVGIYATPTVVINNRLIFNSSSYEEISTLLDQELDRL